MKRECTDISMFSRFLQTYIKNMKILIMVLLFYILHLYHKYSLTDDMVESFSDNNANEIVVSVFNNDTIENIIDFKKKKDMPDGTKIVLDIKNEGYVTLTIK